MKRGENLDYLKKLSILYVEDEKIIREQLSIFLKRRAGVLFTAENGEEGLRVFNEKMPDIVITDIMMPCMDGLKMSEEIRKIDPSAPIIITTAFDQTDYLLRAIETGITNYVLKPVKTETLLTALTRCADEIRGREFIAEQHKLELERLKTRHFKALGILAAGVAHDFNNLLQAIIGYISFARYEAVPGSKIDEYLGIAERASDQARELAKRLMTLTGGASDKFDISEASLVIPVTSALMGGSGIELEYYIPDDLPPVIFDRGALQQIAGYLAQNAREAMPEGGVYRISLSECQIDEENLLGLSSGKYLHFIFSDTGFGITPENLPCIFEPYFTTKQMGVSKGTGLSLALAHSIIGIRGGSMAAASEPGKGTEIHIYLPVAENVASIVA